MVRTRLVVIGGMLFLVTACLLTCGPFAEWSGASMPYQDPTPEMLQQQTTEVEALRHTLLVRSAMSLVLGLAGLGAFGYLLWRRRRERGAR
jgi:LPXTG-motif cell wall-anchored protein